MAKQAVRSFPTLQQGLPPELRNADVDGAAEARRRAGGPAPTWTRTPGLLLRFFLAGASSCWEAATGASSAAAD